MPSGRRPEHAAALCTTISLMMKTPTNWQPIQTTAPTTDAHANILRPEAEAGHDVIRPLSPWACRRTATATAPPEGRTPSWPRTWSAARTMTASCSPPQIQAIYRPTSRSLSLAGPPRPEASRSVSRKSLLSDARVRQSRQFVPVGRQAGPCSARRRLPGYWVIALFGVLVPEAPQHLLPHFLLRAGGRDPPGACSLMPRAVNPGR